MGVLKISVPVPDKVMSFFSNRNVMVTPVSQQETEQLAAAMGGVEDFVSEQSSATALQQIQYIRTVLGRSALVVRTDDQPKGPMQ